MRCLLIAALLGATALPLTAQQPEEQSVMQVVTRLFDGMRTRDTTAMRAAFLPEARMYSFARDGSIRADSPDAWITSIARAPADLVLDEVLHDPEVRVDGTIATVWVYYDFFAGERFSHCGYDAFQLLKAADGWKVASVTDTRRTEGCRQQRK